MMIDINTIYWSKIDLNQSFFLRYSMIYHVN